MSARSSDRRPAKWATYGVAGFYVAVGFVVATASTIRADPLGTLLGFLIIGGAVAVALLIRAIVQIETCLRAAAENVSDLRERFCHLEQLTANLAEQVVPTASSSDGGVRILDLSAIGGGDPSMLTAATLDQGVYPRLVGSNGGHPEPVPRDDADTPLETVDAATDTTTGSGDDSGPTLTDRLKAALHNGDLADCRALASACGVDAAAPLQAEIEALADRIERSLRDAFTGHVRRGDFAAAIAIGERICHLLPDRAVCADFRRIQPHLSHRLTQQRRIASS